MRNLNLDQLRTFATVVEKGGFSAAAESLSLSQPAVSLQIRQLEARLGVRLIERVGRGMGPTAAGEELLLHAERVEADVRAAEESMARFLDDGAGRVRLGTGATACIYTLPPILSGLRKLMPKLEIVITIGEAREMVAAVESNAIDLGFVTLPAAAGRSLSIETIMDDEIVAVFPSDAEFPSDTGAETLARGSLILYEANGNCRRCIDLWFENSGVAAKPVMSLGSVEAIKAMVRIGIGHAILPASAVRGPAGDGLTHRSLTPKLLTTQALAIRRDKRLTRGLRETIAALRSLESA